MNKENASKLWKIIHEAKEDYKAKGFDIFIMNFDREVFGHSACY